MVNLQSYKAICLYQINNLIDILSNLIIIRTNSKIERLSIERLKLFSIQ